MTSASGAASARQLALGFGLALAAAVCWGVGNTVTRISAEDYATDGSDAAAAIVLANYLGGCAVLLALSLGVRLSRRCGPLTPSRQPRRLVVPAIFKAANSYSFVAAATLATASIVALMENLQVLWTAIIVSVLARRALGWRWFASASLMVAGTLLILQAGASSGSDFAGIALGLLAGIAFAGFVVSWGRLGPDPSSLAQRGMDTAVFLAVAGVVVLIVHVVIRVLAGGENVLAAVEAGDLALQVANGTVSVGATYLLITESLRVMRPYGGIGAVLASLGISFAVPITALTELVLLGSPVTAPEWAGLAVYCVGFAIIRRTINVEDTERG